MTQRERFDVANWKAVCDLAGLPINTRLSTAKVIDAMRSRGHAHWTPDQIQRWRRGARRSA